jgi:hypothetical protein
MQAVVGVGVGVGVNVAVCGALWLNTRSI